MACWRPTRSCALQSHRVRQSLQPRPQPLTLRRSASIYTKRSKEPKPVAHASHGAARSEFERRCDREHLCAPPTAASPKPTEATPRFSSNRKEIDNLPGLRQCLGPKKSCLKFPIHNRQHKGVIAMANRTVSNE